MGTPNFQQTLPDLMAQIDQLTDGYKKGIFKNWDAFIVLVRQYFTADVLAQVDQSIPGWQKMASYAEEETLIHVMSVFISLLLLPEYQAAPPEMQNLALWLVAFHDIDKELADGQRDPIHGFKSAARCAAALPRIGFPTRDAYPDVIEDWFALTMNAFIGEGNTAIQDNSKLPEIVSGIDRMFGAESPAALLTEAVLLHMSTTVVPAWPAKAPLTEEQNRRFITPSLHPLVKMIMLVDNDAWAFFSPERRAEERANTLAVFRAMPSYRP